MSHQQRSPGARKAAKAKRRTQLKKAASCMSEDFIADVFEAAMAPNSKPMEPSNNVLASPPRLPGANIIDEEVYAQCELISPALPTLEAIRVDVNPFDVLEERTVVSPVAVDAPVQEKILMRVGRFLSGLVARVGAFVKRGLKVVKHLVSF